MASTIDIIRAFLEARWRARWTRARLDAYHARRVGLAGGIETACGFEQRFAERNALGLTFEQARLEAAHELAGGAPRYAGYSFGFSTGTMGRAGVFLTTERERNQWIGSVLARFVPLRMLAGADIALVLKHNNRLYTDVGKTRRLRLHYFDAAAPDVERVCRVAPQILIGPPSVLEKIARSETFVRRPFRPRMLLAGAEPLYPQDAAALTEFYGVAPRVIYQAREGFLGASCEFGRVHLNEDLIYFERLELGRGRFVPVITDFTRTSQQYRRFRLDDVLIEAPGLCPCKRPFLAVTAVEGRANDVLLFENGRFVLPLEVNAALLPHLMGRDYVVTQPDPGNVTLAMEAVVSTEAIAALAQLVTPARVSAAPFPPATAGEKRRRIRRLFDAHNDWLTRLTVSRNTLCGL